MRKSDSTRFPVFHVPHDGGAFPPDLLQSVCVPMEQFLRYHDKMRDVGVREMVPQLYRTGKHTAIFPVSRLLCDVERFVGEDEPMERYGMGFCYERVFDGTRIKELSEELKQKTLRYYRGHHARLDRLCVEHARILLLDLHSFSDDIVPQEQLRQDEGPPDVCLGIDEKYTPESIVVAAENCLRSEGYTTARNYPYYGSLVPNAVLTKAVGCDCASVMLEWNKRVYCKKTGVPDKEKLAHIRGVIARIADQCVKL